MQCGKTYKFDCENIKWQETSFNDIEKISNRLISQTEDLDHLPEDKKYAFVYLNKEKWGFNILPIYRDESAKVYRGDEVFISFETEQMMESFFDGKK